LAFGPISPAAPGPLYEQVAGAVKREVAAGRLKPGEALPSLRVLAADLMVSLITVKRAYEELEREGIIYRRQGLGTFVADLGHDRSREAKLNTANELFRAAAREAAEAGLKNSEILELAHKIIKGKS
jgi:GntR family transcriptional regulator